MPPTSPKLAAPLAALTFSAVAIFVASCSNTPQGPTSPSNGLTDLSRAPAEYFVTLADEAPAPAPDNSWPPGPPPPAQPGVPVPTPPGESPLLLMRVDPEPVGHSGQPITDVAGCRILKHTWFYDQVVHAKSHVGVTILERENFFDGRFVSRNTQAIDIAGNGTAVFKTRWCSGHPKFHYTQTRYKMRSTEGETFTISGPWVRLLAP